MPLASARVRSGLRLLILIAVVSNASAGRLASRNFSGALSDAARAVRGAAAPGGDEMEEALSRAESAVTACAAQSSACRHSARQLIEACAGIVSDSRSSAGLRHRALTALGKVAGDGNVDPADLPRVVWVCEHAAGQRDIRCGHFLDALNAVGLSKFSDMATLEAIVSVAVQLIEDINFDDEREETPAFVLKAMAVISRFSHRVAADVRICRKVVQAVRLLIERTQTHSARFVMARHLATNVLLHQILPLATAEEVFGEVLEVIELCMRNTGDPAILTPLVQVINKKGIADAHLERFVGVLERMRPVVPPALTLSTVAKRLLADEFRGPAETRLELVARSFEMMERVGAQPLCRSGIRLLHRLQPQEPPSQVLRGMGLAPSLSPELLLQIEDFIPPLPEDIARARIIDCCARTALRNPRKMLTLLHAACLRPARLGLSAAKSFGANVREHGGPLMGRLLRPADFALVGVCLTDATRPGPGWAGTEAIFAQAIAAELLAVAPAIASHWRPEVRQAAMQALCGLIQDMHAICWEE